ncbi:MAG: hypothetical protein AB3N63_12265 [Puniceicoccaceae bacterium]
MAHITGAPIGNDAVSQNLSGKELPAGAQSAFGNALANEVGQDPLPQASNGKAPANARRESGESISRESSEAKGGLNSDTKGKQAAPENKQPQSTPPTAKAIYTRVPSAKVAVSNTQTMPQRIDVESQPKGQEGKVDTQVNPETKPQPETGSEKPAEVPVKETGNKTKEVKPSPVTVHPDRVISRETSTPDPSRDQKQDPQTPVTTAEVLPVPESIDPEKTIALQPVESIDNESREIDPKDKTEPARTGRIPVAINENGLVKDGSHLIREGGKVIVERPLGNPIPEAPVHSTPVAEEEQRPLEKATPRFAEVRNERADSNPGSLVRNYPHGRPAGLPAERQILAAKPVHPEMPQSGVKQSARFISTETIRTVTAQQPVVETNLPTVPQASEPANPQVVTKAPVVPTPVATPVPTPAPAPVIPAPAPVGTAPAPAATVPAPVPTVSSPVVPAPVESVPAQPTAVSSSSPVAAPVPTVEATQAPATSSVPAPTVAPAPTPAPVAAETVSPATPNVQTSTNPGVVSPTAPVETTPAPQTISSPVAPVAAAPASTPEAVQQMPAPVAKDAVQVQEPVVSEKPVERPAESTEQAPRPVPFGHRVRDFVHSRIEARQQERASGQQVREGLGKAVREFVTENNPKAERSVPEPVRQQELPTTERAEPRPVTEPRVVTEPRAVTRAPELQQRTPVVEQETIRPEAKPIAKDGEPVRDTKSSVRESETVAERPVAPRQKTRPASRRASHRVWRETAAAPLPAPSKPEMRRQQVESRISNRAEASWRSHPVNPLPQIQPQDIAAPAPAPFGHTVNSLSEENTGKAGIGQAVSVMAKEKQDKNSRQEGRERVDSISSRVDKSANAERSSASTNRSLPASRVASTQEAFMRVMSAVERMNSTSESNRFQLRLQFENGDEMKVLLKYAKGLLQTVFMTESDGLRVAMRDGWDQFQRQLMERGVDAENPDFHDSRRDQGDAKERQEFLDDFLYGNLDAQGAVAQQKSTDPVREQHTPEVPGDSNRVLEMYA